MNQSQKIIRNTKEVQKWMCFLARYQPIKITQRKIRPNGRKMKFFSDNYLRNSIINASS